MKLKTPTKHFLKRPEKHNARNMYLFISTGKANWKK